MCNERYLRRREDARESREIWQDFVRTEPTEDPERPGDVTEPDPTDAREAIGAPER
jgi:hypothetical protein